MDATANDLDERITQLVLQYAQVAATPPLSGRLSLRRDLAIDSLSLVSLLLRLGDEVGVDPVEHGVEVGRLDTVADLQLLARSLVNANKGDSHE